MKDTEKPSSSRGKTLRGTVKEPHSSLRRRGGKFTVFSQNSSATKGEGALLYFCQNAAGEKISGVEEGNSWLWTFTKYPDAGSTTSCGG